jgi:uncharacterized membrane protein (UPF0127 family)
MLHEITLVYSDGSKEKKQLVMCDTILKRAVGMLTTRKPNKDEAFYIKPCNSIHSFFMAYPIDVAFIDINGNVLKQEHLKQNRVCSCKKAFGVIEGFSLNKPNLSIEKILFY